MPALDDLEKLGYDRKVVAASRPLAETINLIGSQLYVINYLHPAGLLGYVYLMESTPPNDTSLAFLEAYGVRPDAMTFLSRHGQADQRHSRELRTMLDTHFIGSRMREAAITSAVLGLAGINRLLARVRRGNYVNWFPERITDAARPPRTHFPAFGHALTVESSSTGDHDLDNQCQERRNRHGKKEENG